MRAASPFLSMPSVYQLKPVFQGLLRPLTVGLAKSGVTANMVTVAAALLSVATGAWIAYAQGGRWLLLLPAVLFARMALNAIDGMLAREHNQKTSLGAILNELGDVVSDSVLYLPLAIVVPFDANLTVLIVVAAIISEMTGVIGVQVGASRRYDGPMGKSDRAFVFGLLGLLLGSGVRMGKLVVWIEALVALGLLVTIFNRARGALRELRARETTR